MILIPSIGFEFVQVEGTWDWREDKSPRAAQDDRNTVLYAHKLTRVSEFKHVSLLSHLWSWINLAMFFCRVLSG